MAMHPKKRLRLDEAEEHVEEAKKARHELDAHEIDAWSFAGRAQNLNDKMHIENPFKGEPPDFVELGLEHPALGKLLTKRGKGGQPTLDWDDPQSVLELTRALLGKHFNLKFDQPLNRLCPPVPNRLNYICWVADLLALAEKSQEQEGTTEGTSHVPHGIDIGTGASCIYPLLGSRTRGWKFLATEIDEESVNWARKNVQSNDLGGLIEVRLVSTTEGHANGSGEAKAGGAEETSRSVPGPLLMALTESDGSFDFCMTNPPFFGSEEEATANQRLATSATAVVRELIYPGGEVAFVTAMLHDSLILKDRIRWYTATLGRLASLRELIKVLRGAGVINIRSTELCQGRQKRWALGWSFSEDGFVDGKPPLDDPEVNVIGKKKIERRLTRRHQRSSFVFHWTVSTPPTAATEQLGRETPINVVLPDALPHGKEEALARVRAFMAQREIELETVSRDESNDDMIIEDPEQEQIDAVEYHGHSQTTGKGQTDDSFDFSIQIEWLPASETVGKSSETIYKGKITVHLEGEHGSIEAFQRMCDAMHGDVLRQNRHWRREAARANKGAA